VSPFSLDDAFQTNKMRQMLVELFASISVSDVQEPYRLPQIAPYVTPMINLMIRHGNKQSLQSRVWIYGFARKSTSRGPNRQARESGIARAFIFFIFWKFAG
jgi:hypothetical protein